MTVSSVENDRSLGEDEELDEELERDTPLTFQVEVPMTTDGAD